MPLNQRATYMVLSRQKDCNVNKKQVNKHYFYTGILFIIEQLFTMLEVYRYQEPLRE